MISHEGSRGDEPGAVPYPNAGTIMEWRGPYVLVRFDDELRIATAYLWHLNPLTPDRSDPMAGARRRTDDNLRGVFG